MMHTQEELVVIKGKRTKRPRPPSPLLEPIITNNVMIPSPTSNDVATTGTTTTTTTASSEHELRYRKELLEEDDEDMAYCLILLAQGHDHARKASSKHDDLNDHNNKKYLFQCKACNRCFPSFQALGGHRASHNKPNTKLSKNSSVSNLNDDHDHDHCDPTTPRSTILSLQLTSPSSDRPNNLCGTSIITTKTSIKSSAEKSKSHLCSICGAEFSSGQALGGHMRRHRNFLSTTTTSMNGGGNIIINNIGGTESREAKKPRNSNVLKLDLNLPAPTEDDQHHHQREQSSKFSFQTKEKVIVFSTASSLVDCHH